MPKLLPSLRQDVVLWLAVVARMAKVTKAH